MVILEDFNELIVAGIIGLVSNLFEGRKIFFNFTVCVSLESKYCCTCKGPSTNLQLRFFNPLGSSKCLHFPSKNDHLKKLNVMKFNKSYTQHIHWFLSGKKIRTSKWNIAWNLTIFAHGIVLKNLTIFTYRN